MSADERAFVDTNVLVYAHDTTAGRKRETALSIVHGLWDSGLGCVSVQVLQELFVTLTRKVVKPLPAEAARETIEGFTYWTVHAPQAEDVVEAARLHERLQTSFWDAMIVHSAAALGCTTLYSEDLTAGQRYESVLVVDPFGSLRPETA